MRRAERAVVLLVVLSGCGPRLVLPPRCETEEGLPRVVATRELTPKGGRVDWCHAKNVIAFDRSTDVGDGRRMDVYTVLPDGSGERCVTCGLPGLPEGIRGQPAWHPSCDLLLVQAEGPHAQKGAVERYEHVSWGIHNDLWVVAADGSYADRLVEVPALGATLHPQFASGGDRVVWSSRQATHASKPSLQDLTPGGEDPWEGWRIETARFVPRAGSTPARLEDLRVVLDAPGFYETHALVGSTLWFSHTPAGRGPYVEDIHRAELSADFAVVRDENQSQSEKVWDEHGQPSPSGRAVVFNSSQGYALSFPAPAVSLRLELHLLEPSSGRRCRLTAHNESVPWGARALTSDFAWGPGGREIVSYWGTLGGGTFQERVEVLTLSGDP